MHWQNGITECFIKSITQHARTILLHAMVRWPLVITEEMWPLAVQHAVTFHNALIHWDKNDSPYRLFTGEDCQWMLNNFRVLGCPVYVLHKKLQDGDSFLKWWAHNGIDGSQQLYGRDYWEMYAPVVTSLISRADRLIILRHFPKWIWLITYTCIYLRAGSTMFPQTLYHLTETQNSMTPHIL